MQLPVPRAKGTAWMFTATYSRTGSRVSVSEEDGKGFCQEWSGHPGKSATPFSALAESTAIQKYRTTAVPQRKTMHGLQHALFLYQILTTEELSYSLVSCSKLQTCLFKLAQQKFSQIPSSSCLPHEKKRKKKKFFFSFIKILVRF